MKGCITPIMKNQMETKWKTKWKLGLYRGYLGFARNDGMDPCSSPYISSL